MNAPFVLVLRFDPKPDGVHHTIVTEAAGWRSGNDLIVCDDPHVIAAAAAKAASALGGICPLAMKQLVAAPPPGLVLPH